MAFRSLVLGSIAGMALSGAAFMTPQTSSADTLFTPINFVELSKLSYFIGREYFLLRSGRAQLILQSDRADLGPAFTYLMFDAQDPIQSKFKDGAFNFDPVHAFTKSALQVRLGGYAFTAFGNRTETRWVLHNQIPAVEAIWWAGGIRVKEHFLAYQSDGVFQRSIYLEGSHLAGPETVSLRLTLPAGSYTTSSRTWVWNGPKAKMAISILGDTPAKFNNSTGELELGPFTVSPGQQVPINTLLSTQIGGAPQNFPQFGSALDAFVATQKKWQSRSWVTAEDPVIRGMYEKALFGLPAMVADDGAMDAGIFEYGAQWVRDTSNTALGLIHIGEFELARAAIERMLKHMIGDNGATMIAGSFESPDREQFDQMGEFLHVLKAYRDWSGDDSLIRAYSPKILALVERPLGPIFRDATGMVHNKREFWERAFDDAYELAYQMWVSQGLNDAADMALELGALDRVPRWQEESRRIREAMLGHPTRALVDQGRLIKRRNLTGEVVDYLKTLPGYSPDVPATTESHHRLLPDSTQSLPIAMRIVDPKSALSLATLDQLEELWNTRWSDGGYDRYNTSSQPDQPGPWPFATCFIMRAQHEAGLFDRSRRALEWLHHVQGGRVGSWFEEITSVHSMAKSSGIVQWTSGEVALFVVRHWLGIRFNGKSLVLEPRLYPGLGGVKTNLRYRSQRLLIELAHAGPFQSAEVNGVIHPLDPNGRLHLPADFSGGIVRFY